MGKDLKIQLLECLEMFRSVTPTCLCFIPILMKRMESWEFSTKGTVLFLLIFNSIIRSIVKSTDGLMSSEITASLTLKTSACMDLTTFQMDQFTLHNSTINLLSPHSKLMIAEISISTGLTVFQKIDKSSFKQGFHDNSLLLSHSSPKVTVFCTSFTLQLRPLSKLFTIK